MFFLVPCSVPLKVNRTKVCHLFWFNKKTEATMSHLVLFHKWETISHSFGKGKWHLQNHEPRTSLANLSWIIPLDLPIDPKFPGHGKKVLKSKIHLAPSAHDANWWFICRNCTRQNGMWCIWQSAPFSHLSHEKKTLLLSMALYWLFNRDFFNGNKPYNKGEFFTT